MNRCHKYKRDLVAYLSNELAPSRAQEVAEHLKHCSACQKEVEEIKRLFSMSKDFKTELQEVMSTVDWDKLPSILTDRVWKREEERQKKLVDSWFYRWRWQPLAAGLIFGLLLGAFFTYFVIKPQKPSFLTARQESKVSVPADFIEKVDLALARRETIDYLDRSQYLILELLQTRKQDEVSIFLTRDKIQQLLTEKKYLNAQLDDVKLLKAKAICDQIELLFLELTQLSSGLSEAELERVREMIEERQLLLKINLVKKELQQSEV
ncbi:MAG: zf-HC2 domain-containing protein [Candidatus Aminicenantes bacterium]|nr:zf-HC2 domain-containing protein [Candidatus Aminicenantes bacterium]